MKLSGLKRAPIRLPLMLSMVPGSRSTSRDRGTYLPPGQGMETYSSLVILSWTLLMTPYRVLHWSIRWLCPIGLCCHPHRCPSCLFHVPRWLLPKTEREKVIIVPYGFSCCFVLHYKHTLELCPCDKIPTFKFVVKSTLLGKHTWLTYLCVAYYLVVPLSCFALATIKTEWPTLTSLTLISSQNVLTSLAVIDIGIPHFES